MSRPLVSAYAALHAFTPFLRIAKYYDLSLMTREGRELDFIPGGITDISVETHDDALILIATMHAYNAIAATMGIPTHVLVRARMLDCVLCHIYATEPLDNLCTFRGDHATLDVRFLQDILITKFGIQASYQEIVLHFTTDVNQGHICAGYLKIKQARASTNCRLVSHVMPVHHLLWLATETMLDEHAFELE